MSKDNEGKWLLLIHNIPPKPTYFRVKIWRRLQKLGAVAIKNSVYVLPKSEASNEAFQWVTKEITQGKGDATICEATFVEGLTNHEIRGLFESARNADYAELMKDTKKVLDRVPKKLKPDDAKRKEFETSLTGLKKRLQEIYAIDFFSSSGREGAEGLIGEIDDKLKFTETGRAQMGEESVAISKLQKRVWVTRKGIHVDRIASAWLIKRFIDPKASFKFVDAKGYTPQEGELRFDMFEAEFTHEGDNCSFEVLISRTNLTDPALNQIAQIIHDIDLRDKKFGRDDTLGIERVINGICMNHKEDTERLRRGSDLFDDLHEYFSRKKL